MLNKIATFHETKTGLLVFAAIELALAYGLGSLAIDSGSLWQWALTALLLLGVVQNLARFGAKFRRQAHHG